MYDEFELRTLEITNYFLEHHSTVRATAKALKISKSSVHNHLTHYLPKISLTLADEVNSLLALNKAERSKRGGRALRKKYERERSL